MKLSDFYEGMEGYTPVNPGIPEAPVAPNPNTQVSPYLRTTQPLPLQYSGDTVKQYNRPGLSTFRIAPLPPAGIPTIVATAASTATGIVNTAIAAIPPVVIPPTPTPVSNGIPRPNTRRFSIWDFTPNTITGGEPGTFIGADPPVVTSGAGGNVSFANGPDAGDGMYAQLTASTAGAVGLANYLVTPDLSTASWIVAYRTGRNLMFQTRLRFPTAPDLVKALNWVAFTDQVGATNALNLSGKTPASSGVPTASTAGNIVGLFFGDLGSGVSWYGVCQNATGPTSSQILLGTSDANSHVYQVSMNDTTGTVSFFIDGVQLGAISTNLPPSGTNMGLFAGAANTNHTATNLNIEYFYIERDY